MISYAMVTLQALSFLDRLVSSWYHTYVVHRTGALLAYQAAQRPFGQSLTSRNPCVFNRSQNRVCKPCICNRSEKTGAGSR